MINETEQVRLTIERFQESRDLVDERSVGVRCELGTVSSRWDGYLVVRRQDPTIIQVSRDLYHQALRNWFEQRLEQTRNTPLFNDAITAVEALMSGDLKPARKLNENPAGMRWPLKGPFNAYLRCEIREGNNQDPNYGASWIMDTSNFDLIGILSELEQAERSNI